MQADDNAIAWATVDLDALKANARRLEELAQIGEPPGNVPRDGTRVHEPTRNQTAPVHMAVVKADAYGHGLVPAATALAQAGRSVFGIAQIPEAIHLAQALRETEVGNARIFSWLVPPTGGQQLIEHALDLGIELSVSTPQQVLAIAATKRPARVHLKVDTGMGRAGLLPGELEGVLAALQQCAPRVQLVGMWSHLAKADEDTAEGKQFTARQLEYLRQAHHEVQRAHRGILKRTGGNSSANLKQMGAESLSLALHLAATAGQIWHPDTRLDMVRDGIGLYGLSPNPQVETEQELGLHPAMTLNARLMQVKRIPRGWTVSYGGTWRAEQDTWIGLVPLGYADGIARAASNRAWVRVYSQTGAWNAPVVGRICMDQFMIKLGEGKRPPAAVGDRVVIYGDPTRTQTRGCPTASDWAGWADTISYEVLTRVGARVLKCYVGGSEG
ncbi:alanine racemase [Gleimia hominis]|uniref:Alanine racemase n=1 Tax=Gleimia hominis TaxID=595468 RepID=A0ABU3IAC4_9ACTO|nr:alanine racemase [Gleimia hominis]MDT3767178.1 alanine racemase [Gleimia hominis]